ncbi:MAG TPA: FAD-dependent oxidoreductase, partial [Nitrososphaerales archaeon]|nr:FAD-dependent oxidoreductase [Nitrososphaerales archaeon]
MAGRYDILVIGAGIMGVASAYHLQKNNPQKRVLVVDRYGAVGQGNTGRSNAMFRNTFSSSDNQILADASIDFYLHVQEDLKADLGLQKIGYLWLMDQAQLSKSQQFLRRMEDHAIETVVHDRQDIQSRLPGLVTDFGGDEEAGMMGLPNVDGGVFGPKCGRLDPDKLTRYYAEQFINDGGKFAFNSDVKALVVGPSKRLGLDGEPLVWQETKIEGVALS